MSAERRVHKAGRRRNAPHQREVFLADAALGKGFRQPKARLFRQGHANETRSILVQTVHDTGPEAFLRPQGGKARHQPMHQRPFRTTGRGMHGQACGLVDDG